LKKTKNQKEEQKGGGAAQYRWAFQVFLMAVALSAALSLASESMLSGAGVAVALFILALFILLGIVFDVIGVAVTAADPRPFHSMAAHKERGAREALGLLRNASHVSSVCNDVVGDICGIVSGATGAVIAVRLQMAMNTQTVLLSVGVTALVSGLTIGGKALGKHFAMKQSTRVVYWAGRFLHIFHRSSR
jgi:CBS domain containing-hemolysin-like protein